MFPVCSFTKARPFPLSDPPRELIFRAASPAEPGFQPRFFSAPAIAMPAQRIRGRKLQRIRANAFRAEPLCVACQAKGIVRLADELDHIVPLHKGGADVEGNRQPLCKPCHLAKSIEERWPRQRIDESGWPV